MHPPLQTIVEMLLAVEVKLSYPHRYHVARPPVDTTAEMVEVKLSYPLQCHDARLHVDTTVEMLLPVEVKSSDRFQSHVARLFLLHPAETTQLLHHRLYLRPSPQYLSAHHLNYGQWNRC